MSLLVPTSILFMGRFCWASLTAVKTLVLTYMWILGLLSWAIYGSETYLNGAGLVGSLNVIYEYYDRLFTGDMFMLMPDYLYALQFTGAVRWHSIFWYYPILSFVSRASPTSMWHFLFFTVPKWIHNTDNAIDNGKSYVEIFRV
jgi:hypothetical protein